MSMTNKRWIYCGDVNPENGGYWFNIAGLQWGYVDAVRVTPMADAGGPDNQFWIESLTVNMPTNEIERKRVLDCIGCGEELLPSGATGRNILIDACIAYGRYDVYESRTVRIGPHEENGAGFDPVNCETVLRAGSSLANWVRREFLRTGAA